MKASILAIAIFAHLLFFLNRLQAQQTIPEGTRFSLITDLNRWVTVCRDCQKLKYPDVVLTLTSNTDALSREPNEESVLTAEYQDGKIRLRTSYGTYVSVCEDCRISGPSYLLTATARKDNNGKVIPEALFDFIPVENSCFYMIKTFNGKYVTRYHPGSHRPDMLKGKSQVMAAYYDKTDRRAGKFEIIAKSFPFPKEYVAGFNPPKAVKHDILLGRNWISSTFISNNRINYFLERRINLESIFPTRTCEGDHICWTHVFAAQPGVHLRKLNFHDNTREFKFKIEYLGDNKGYKINGYENRALSLMDTPNNTPCNYNTKGQMVSFKDWEGENCTYQLWNIERKCDNFYLIQNRGSGLYLGKTYVAASEFSIYSLVDKKDAIEFAFEKVINKLPPESSEIGYTFKFIDIPGKNEMIADPSLLPFRTWEETVRTIRSTTNYSYAGFDDWQVATLEKAEKITEDLKNSCRSYLKILSFVNRYYYYDSINEGSWRSDLSILKQMSISQQGTVTSYSGFEENQLIYSKAKVLLWRSK